MNKKNAFYNTVRHALKNFREPTKLGKSSPLSSIYFLGNLTSHKGKLTTNGERGIMLQNLLLDAAAYMWGETLPSERQELETLAIQDRDQNGNFGAYRYHYWLLELCYFRNYYLAGHEPSRIEDVYDFVGISRSPFYEHLSAAIEHLAESVSKMAQPSFRLESPILQTPLVGRQHLIDQCLSDLAQNRMVALTGLGGVGKTSVGIAIKTDWEQGDVFWYTIRPHLNDHAENFLFALSHFLNRAGQSRLWMHMISRGEQANQDNNLTIGLLKEDLQALETTPLLCLDEVDLLGAGYMEEDAEMWHFIEMIDSLKQLCPLLLIGHRSLIDTNSHYHIRGLSHEQIVDLLANRQVALPSTEVEKVAQITNGNPRLIQLIIALLHSGEHITEILHTLGTRPSSQPLLHRLWRHLNQDEQHLFGQMSVFRGIVPDFVWKSPKVVDKLVQRNLIQIDQQGGIALIPTFRQLMYNNLSGEQRAQFHHTAATIREKFGQYTAAAYHYWCAGDDDEAVELWFTQREKEVNQGESATALELFNQLSSNKLNDENKKKLALIRQQLHLILGNVDSAIQAGQSIAWDDDILSAEYYARQGSGHYILGNEEDVLYDHTVSINILGELIHKMIDELRRRSDIYHRLGNKKAYTKDIQLAEYYFTLFKGKAHYQMGEYKEAHQHLQTALNLARTHDNISGIANTCRLLAIIANYSGDEAAARSYSDEAIQFYEQKGDLLNAETVRTNLAGMMIQYRRFEEAITPLESSLAFYEKIGADVWIANTLTNLAECYLETEQIEKAQKSAFRVIQMENIQAHPYALHVIGLIHEKRSDYDLAEVALQQGVEIATENDSYLILAYLLRALGRMCCRTGRISEGVAHLNQANALFKKMTLDYEVEETQKMIAQFNEQSNSEKATTASTS